MIEATTTQPPPAEHRRAAGEGGVNAVGPSVDAAATASAVWAAATPAQRGDVLRRAADLLERRGDELAELICLGVDKPIAEAGAEAARTVRILRFAAGLGSAPTGRVWQSDDPRTTVLAVRAPVGVVALVTPFNFPAAIPTWKLAPALVAGNGVLLKPHPAAAGPARSIAAALGEAGLPEGVLQVVEGDADVGSALVAHAGVDAVSFTGSAAAGRSVAGLCVARGARVQLELGGKNTAIVLADADLESAAADIATAAFGYAGQKCTATSRVLVAAPVGGRFTELLAAATERVRVGDASEPATVCGPVLTAARAEELRATLSSRRPLAQAATPGGERFVAPTLLGDVGDDDPVWVREQFGPVLALREVAGLDEAIEQVAAVDGGLAVGLHTRSSTTVHAAVRRLRAGVVAVNRPTTGLDAHVPFGGLRGSGAGPREQGPDATDFFTEERTVYWREPA